VLRHFPNRCCPNRRFPSRRFPNLNLIPNQIQSFRCRPIQNRSPIRNFRNH
jgi:hypothetical protein